MKIWGRVEFSLWAFEKMNSFCFVFVQSSIRDGMGHGTWIICSEIYEWQKLKHHFLVSYVIICCLNNRDGDCHSFAEIRPNHLTIGLLRLVLGELFGFKRQLQVFRFIWSALDGISISCLQAITSGEIFKAIQKVSASTVLFLFLV